MAPELDKYITPVVPPLRYAVTSPFTTVKPVLTPAVLGVMIAVVALICPAVVEDVPTPSELT